MQKNKPTIAWGIKEESKILPYIYRKKSEAGYFLYHYNWKLNMKIIKVKLMEVK